MKKISTEKDLTPEEFINLLNKGYSGGGDDEKFILTSLGGKELKTPIIVPQEIISLYNVHYQVTAMLLQKLKDWK